MFRSSFLQPLSLVFALFVTLMVLNCRQCEAQTNSATRQPSVPPPVGYWEGTIRPKKEIPLIPADGILLKLEFENLSGELTGTLDAASQVGKIRRLKFDAESGKLTGKASVSAFAFDVDIVFSEEQFDGWLMMGDMKVAVDGKKTRKPSLDLTVYTKQMWLEDIEFLATELPRRHHSFFRGFDESEWSSACKRLVQKLPELDVNDIPFWINHLIALKGDDHTRLATNHLPAYRSAPVSLWFFEDGVFVTAVPKDFAGALGCRVIKIGEQDVQQVLKRLDELFKTENDSWRKYLFARQLSIPRVLKNIGAQEDAAAFEFTVEDPDTNQPVEYSIPSDYQVGQWITRVSELEPESYPLFATNTNKNYWGRYLKPDSAVYVAYNRCREDSNKPFQKFVDSLARIIKNSKPERIVIDLRKNSGGSSPVIAPLIKLLNENRQFADNDRLFVLIGRRTFSSAMMNSHQLRDQCNAILVGEPTGGKPNHYGEIMPFELPNSRLAVWRSTKYFQHVEGNPPSVMPQHRVIQSSGDYFGCVDPVLEFALKFGRNSQTGSD